MKVAIEFLNSKPENFREIVCSNTKTLKKYYKIPFDKTSYYYSFVKSKLTFKLIQKVLKQIFKNNNSNITIKIYNKIVFSENKSCQNSKSYDATIYYNITECKSFKNIRYYFDYSAIATILINHFNSDPMSAVDF